MKIDCKSMCWKGQSIKPDQLFTFRSSPKDFFSFNVCVSFRWLPSGITTEEAKEDGPDGILSTDRFKLKAGGWGEISPVPPRWPLLSCVTDSTDSQLPGDTRNLWLIHEVASEPFINSPTQPKSTLFINYDVKCYKGTRVLWTWVCEKRGAVSTSHSSTVQ